MTFFNSKQKIVYCSALLFLSQISFANAETILKPKNDQDDGFLEVGLSYIVYDTAIVGEGDSTPDIVINGRYQWDNLFVEANNKVRNNAFTIGYNLYSTEYWDYDLVVTTSNSARKTTTGSSVFNRVRGAEVHQGARATGYIEDWAIQINLLPVGQANKRATLSVGRQWQVGNWIFYGTAEIDYNSKESLSFYVNDALNNDALQRGWVPSRGMNFTGRIGTSYPLAENWVFDSFYEYTSVPSNITTNPLPIKLRNNLSTTFVSLSYVF